MENTKVCKVCQTGYPATLEYFHKQKNGKFGCRTICKKCVANTTDREARRKYHSQYYQKNRIKVNHFLQHVEAERLATTTEATKSTVVETQAEFIEEFSLDANTPEDDTIAMKIAEEELSSTKTMLSSLTTAGKREAIVSSQQKEFDYYAQLKADHALAESLQVQENTNDTSNDEAIARTLQAEHDNQPAYSKTSTSGEQLANDKAYAQQLQTKFDNEMPRAQVAQNPTISTSCRQESTSASAASLPRLVR